MERIGQFFMKRPRWLLVSLLLLLAALPLAIWMDLRSLSDQALSRQASSLNAVINSVRGYYARNVVSRATAFDGDTIAIHNYLEEPGAIPIPATMSLELGREVSGATARTAYRFVSDYPFEGRAPHDLSLFEQEALATFRQDKRLTSLVTGTGGIFDRRVTLATPVVMEAACVACHNAHPMSPRNDWVIGDIRAVQTVSVDQPLALNILSFKWILTYLVVAGTASILYFSMQHRLASQFRSLSSELQKNNEFLAGISMKISKYLSPQVYRSIFAGEKDVALAAERKKLTVFFSDIKDFTSTTERMQPEELTQLLNEYFTEMSKIAEAHGATIDKFVGDAMIAFFGDPHTRGTANDARACVHMALAMQERMKELEVIWQAKGFEHPFKVRMGINTGFCNVGNFGSDERMDYTIIGAEANLAARMESIAEAGGIVISYETYALAQDLIHAEPGEPVRLKGLAREVTPYIVRGLKTRPRNKIETRFEAGQLVVDLENSDNQTRLKVHDAVKAALREAMRSI